MHKRQLSIGKISQNLLKNAAIPFHLRRVKVGTAQFLLPTVEVVSDSWKLQKFVLCFLTFLNYPNFGRSPSNANRAVVFSGILFNSNMESLSGPIRQQQQIIEINKNWKC